MTIKLLTNQDEAVSAAELAEKNHCNLRSEYPFLPQKTAEDFRPRIEWMMKEGRVFGSFNGPHMTAFLGAFTLDDFRNEGAGSLTPDWCLYSDPAITAKDGLLELYKTLLGEILKDGIEKHAVCIPSHRQDTRELFELLDYGRIVLDAAMPQAELLESLKDIPEAARAVVIRKAQPSDAASLSSLDASLARHIGAIPVLMPNTKGGTMEEWKAWLEQDDAAAFIASTGAEDVGFIKAQDPQFDVTFSVQDSLTFGINGLFVRPEFRGRQIARSLLYAVATEAKARGKNLVSVDCETMNQEAYTFWSRYFRPVSWSLLRRFGKRNI